MTKSVLYTILKAIFTEHSFIDNSTSIYGTDNKEVVFSDEGENDADTCIIICPLDKDDYDDPNVYEDLDSYDVEPQYIMLNDITAVTFKNERLVVSWNEHGKEYTDSFMLKR